MRARDTTRSHRVLRLAAAAGLLGMVIVAALGAQPARAANDDPAPTGTLRVGVSGLPASLGNPFKGNGRPGTLVWYAMYDGLTRLDEEGRLVPSLALSWDLLEPTRWRFTLRSDVNYSNGKRFDATAAAAVLTWLTSKEGRATVIGNELRGMTAARAIDAITLEVITQKPDPILPKRMVGALMVEPSAWQQLGPDQFALQPIGTGAFVLQSWDQRRRRAHARFNPKSWRTAHFAELEFVELPDAAVRTQALLSRDIDITPVEIEELSRLEDRGFPILARPSMSVMSLAFITERETPGPLQDQRVRQALNHAVDRQTIARELLRGYGRPSGQPAPSVSFGYDPRIAPYSYDPQRARELLAQAGYPDGFSLDAQILINSFPADGLIYQSVAHYLRKVGVDVTLRVIPFAQYLRNLQRNTFSGDAFGSMWNSAPYNDATRPMETFSCNRPKPVFCDRALTAKLEAAKLVLNDDERRSAMQAVSRAYHEAAPALFLVEQVDLYAHNPTLTQVRLRNRVPVYDDVRRAENP